jgi:hypothetical protein
MPILIRTRRQRLGLAVYGVGPLAYFGSWLAVMSWPDTGPDRVLGPFDSPDARRMHLPWEQRALLQLRTTRRADRIAVRARDG